MAKIDFHMHSIRSCDGDFAPEALVDKAAEAGIETIAIADHNTTGAVAPATRYGRAKGVEVIPAVELDCLFDGLIFHVLGYGIDPDNPALRKIDEDIQCQEKAAAKERIRLINEAGIELDEAEALSMAKDGVFVVGELIAEIVLNKPNAADNPLLRPYLPGGARDDNPYVNFFWDFCGQDMPAYVHIEYVTMRHALDVIHGCGGVAVLAHPGKNLDGRLDLLPAIVREGIDGIECYSSYHAPEVNRYFVDRAAEHGLLVTGGSDYHGKTKPSIFMGQFGLDGDGTDLREKLKSAIAARR